ncbi:hypothetical protein A8M45_27030 [Escherichia coli]|nr:hypothetical protein A8G02_26045 [Escherichia coli]OWE28466.1 hypothetical protein A8M45_27030 [Escherichia coli]OWE32500.1 hypothetical protein A8M42_27560 [Escherichia coli]OWE66057.1 hypothetical protein A8M73_27185 [Escherichia coli]
MVINVEKKKMLLENLPNQFLALRMVIILILLISSGMSKVIRIHLRLVIMRDGLLITGFKQL